MLDDDGQTPVDYLPQMIDILKNDYDVVSAVYIDCSRKSLIRTIGTKVNMMMSQWLIDRPKGITVSDFLLRNVL